MHLLLLRHADAESDALTEVGRGLSEKGKGQAKKVARFIKGNELAPELILTSPVRRAQQTAEFVAQHIGAELLTVPWAACGMHPQGALDELRAYANFARVLIVGHEPDFSQFAAHVLGIRDPVQICIRKASLTYLDLPALTRGAGRLQWSLPCRFM